MNNNIKKNLVSILSPVYNGEEYVEDFLNSIYNQSYPYLQLIVVDDGSNDKTKEILYSWEDKFKRKNIEFIILSQVNLGASKAISKGFKYCNGSYFVWMDSDDELSTTAIEKRVRILEASENDCFVMDRAIFKDEYNNTVGYYKRNKEANLFWDIIREKNVFFSGIYMLRMDQADEVFSQKMYHSSAGQNFQIILPLAYKYKVILNPENSYTYRIHSNSHSQKILSSEDKIKRFTEHEKIIVKTLLNMNLSNIILKKGIKIARISKYSKICNYLLSINQKQIFRTYFKKLSYYDLKFISFKKKLKFLFFYYL